MNACKDCGVKVRWRDYLFRCWKCVKAARDADRKPASEDWLNG